MGQPKLDDLELNDVGSELTSVSGDGSGATNKNDYGTIDLGRPDTLRYNVLSYVSKEEYDRGIKMLRDFIEKDSAYPNFRLKVERYTLHCIDLIFAIRTKHNFPGLSNMTLTKQQELKVKCKEHFTELSQVMQKIENCLEELRLEDVKSTKIVIRSIWYAVLTVFLFGLVSEFSQGLVSAFIGMSVDLFNELIQLAINKFF